MYLWARSKSGEEFWLELNDLGNITELGVQGETLTKSFTQKIGTGEEALMSKRKKFHEGVTELGLIDIPFTVFSVYMVQ